MLTERRERALEDLDQAVSNGTASSGIEPVWRASRRSTPGLLIVEDGFEQPAQINASLAEVLTGMRNAMDAQQRAVAAERDERVHLVGSREALVAARRWRAAGPERTRDVAGGAC